MPTYDYRCTACKHEFEQFQSMKDKTLRKCPKCGKNALERLIGTGGAIIFKGGGFYQTDYRSESYRKAADADKKPVTAETTSSGTDSGKSSAGKAADAGSSDKPATKETGSSKPASGSGGAGSTPASKPGSGGKSDKPEKSGRKR